MPALKQLSDLPDHKAVRIAKSNLISCGCLDFWEQLMRLSNEGKNVKLDIIRLHHPNIYTGHIFLISIRRVHNLVPRSDTDESSIDEIIGDLSQRHCFFILCVI